MGKCFIDSINNKFVLNGTSIAFEEFTKFKNGKILTLDGAEIIDSSLLSRLGVQGGKLTLDGLMVNSLDLSSVAQNIIPTTDISITLGSDTKKLANVYSDALTANSLVIGTGSAITFDGTVFRVGNDTLATREWVNSSAIPVLKTINGVSLIGTGDIELTGGTGGQLSDYSTTETLTERRWIDGKPIYRTVVNLGNQSALANDTGVAGTIYFNTDKNVETTVTSNVLLGAYDEYPEWYGSITSQTRYGATATKFSCYVSSSNSGMLSDVKIICEYTKSTDTSASPVAYIAGGGSPKKYYARLSNGSAFSFNRTVAPTTIPLNTLVKGDLECSDGVNGFIAPQDDIYTVESNYWGSNATMANINEVIVDLCVNGVVDTRFANSLSTGGYTKSCNGSVSLKLAKGDKVTFKMWCWATDTTTALSVPVGSLVANIRN